jgi:hypothetical protein
MIRFRFYCANFVKVLKMTPKKEKNMSVDYRHNNTQQLTPPPRLINKVSGSANQYIIMSSIDRTEATTSEPAGRLVSRTITPPPRATPTFTTPNECEIFVTAHNMTTLEIQDLFKDMQPLMASGNTMSGCGVGNMHWHKWNAGSYYCVASRRDVQQYHLALQQHLSQNGFRAFYRKGGTLCLERMARV